MKLPAIHSLLWGSGAITVGSLLVTLGMASLWLVGGGLPMNAFPPPRYVSSGIYSFFSHPIYVGFSLVCVGTAIAAGSASGLWLVSTTVALASSRAGTGIRAAQFAGTLRQCVPRTAPAARRRPILPFGHGAHSLLSDRIVALVPDLRSLRGARSPAGCEDRISSPFESRLPVLPWTEIFYGSVYVVVLLVPLIVRTRYDLRLFSSRALLAMVIIFPLYLAVPLIAPPRSFVAIGRLGEWLNLDRAHDSAATAFPSFHVVWAFIAAEALARGPWQKRLWRAWAVLVSASCVTTGMHALADAVAGLSGGR